MRTTVERVTRCRSICSCPCELRVGERVRRRLSAPRKPIRAVDTVSLTLGALLLPPINSLGSICSRLLPIIRSCPKERGEGIPTI